MYDINLVADYIIFKCKSEGGGVSLSNLKLQKLLYYSQAWHLAFYKRRLFVGSFEAWIHGPVNRIVYNRFRVSKSIYDEINLLDIQSNNFLDVISPEQKAHIDSVLEVYAKYAGTQLEAMTHSEMPWISARRGINPIATCSVVINEDLMAKFYSEMNA